MKEGEIFFIGLIFGMFIMGIVMRVSFAIDPEFYGDRCLNDPDYRIDTIRSTCNSDTIQKVEYKFIRK